MTNNDKWYDAYTIVCIKKYETLNVGSSYKVEGRGSLQYNHAAGAKGKTGWGVCITHENMVTTYNKGFRDYFPFLEIFWKIDYYLTLDELNEYFITNDEHYTIMIRDEKLNSLLE